MTFKNTFVVFFLFNFVTKSTHSQTASSGCISGPSSYYTGTQNVTQNNRPCLRWDSMNSTLLPPDGTSHNFCRNPDFDVDGTWCHIIPGNLTVKGYCGIPKCATDAIAIWTALNRANGTTVLSSIVADPEYVSQRKLAGASDAFKVINHMTASHLNSEYWSVTSDYDSKRIFWGNYRGNLLHVYNLTSKSHEDYHSGIVAGIEGLAYDTFSGNLYWADSYMHWIMASDSTFQHYTVVHSTAPMSPYGLAIHISKRLLFFSSHILNEDSAIWSSDLSGNNVSAILKSPQTFRVNSITIDYETDRLYWVDLTRSTTISSSRLDGSDVQLIVRESQLAAIYFGIAVFENFIYVTNVRSKRGSSGRRHYDLLLFGKSQYSDGKRRKITYHMAGRPRGITIFHENNVTKRPSAFPGGECNAAPPCQHVCLPSLQGRRTCACTLGFEKDGDVSCVARIPPDEFIAVTDLGQGRIFYRSPAADQESPYNIIPIQNDSKATTVAFNIPERLLYWSDRRNNSIFRSTFDGQNVTKLITGLHAGKMAVHPLNGHVYFSDSQFPRIFVMDGNGQFLKTLYKLIPSEVFTPNINALAIDIQNNYIYWTESVSSPTSGLLRRMKLDGSKHQTIYSNLNRPHGLAIDLQGEKLYLSEATLSYVYEIPFESLDAGGSIEFQIKLYDLSPYFNQRGRNPNNIADIVVLNDSLYLYNVANNNIYAFNLTDNYNETLRQVGPGVFFTIATISVISRSYYNRYEASLPNPCDQHECQHLCFAITPSSSRCDCQDGYFLENNECIKSLTAVDYPPLSNDCSEDIEIEVEYCRNETEITWPEPTWSDDNTPSADLIITPPNVTSPSTFPLGSHEIRYAATDSEGNTAVCSFNLIVKARQCSAKPYFRKGLALNETSVFCTNRTNTDDPPTLAYRLTCGSDQLVSYAGSTQAVLTNFCTDRGYWLHSNLFGIHCVEAIETSTFNTSVNESTTQSPMELTQKSETTTSLTLETTQSKQQTATESTNQTSIPSASQSVSSISALPTGATVDSRRLHISGAVTQFTIESSTIAETEVATQPATTLSIDSSTKQTTIKSSETATISYINSSTILWPMESTTQTTEQTTSEPSRLVTSPSTIETTQSKHLSTQLVTELTIQSRFTSVPQSASSAITSNIKPTTTRRPEGPEVEPPPDGGGLSTGAIVAIALVVVVLIAILTAVLIIRTRKRTTTFVLPMRWNPKPDHNNVHPNVFEDANNFTAL